MGVWKVIRIQDVQMLQFLLSHGPKKVELGCMNEDGENYGNPVKMEKKKKQRKQSFLVVEAIL